MQKQTQMSKPTITDNLLGKLSADLTDKELSTCLTTKQQQRLFELCQMGGYSRIVAAILNSPTPATNLKKVIDFLSEDRSDWGYPDDILEFFVQMAKLGDTKMINTYGVQQTTMLKDMLYNALFVNYKYNAVSIEEARSLASMYFPKKYIDQLEQDYEQNPHYYE